MAKTAAKKAAAKKTIADAAQTFVVPLAAPIHPDAEETPGPLGPCAIPLDQLYVAPENPRHGQQPEDVDPLAANIDALGVLEIPIGYRTAIGVALVEGRRRLAALLRLDAKRLAERPDDPVPTQTINIVRRAEAAAIAASTAAQRVAMGAADEARAWAAMMVSPWADQFGDDERRVAAIARVMGVTIVKVRQRLALAALHPPILAALRAGEIALDRAQAFTRVPLERQIHIWDDLGPNASTYDFDKALAKDALRAGDPLARFVGESAYRAAGGVVSADLFGAPEDALWLDPKLARKLADKKLADEAERLKAEGWSFVETKKADAHPATTAGKKRAPTPDEARRLKELKAESDRLGKAANALWDRDSEDDAETRKYEAEAEKLEAQRDKIDEEIEALEDSLVEFAPAQRAKLGAMAMIGRDGALKIVRGITPKAEPKSSNAAKSTSAAREEKPKAPPPIAAPAHNRLVQQAERLVALKVRASPQLALALMVAHLAREFWAPHSEGKVLDIETGYGVGKWPKDAPGAELVAKADGIARARLAAHLKKPAALERALFAAPTSDLLELLAHFVAHCLSTGEQANAWSAPDKWADPIGRESFAALASLAGGINPSETTADHETLKAMSADALAAAAKEMALDLGAGKAMAQPALAAKLADRAAEINWVHPVARAITGAPASSLVPEKGQRAGKLQSAEKPKPKQAKPAPKPKAKKQTAEARP